MSAVVRPAAADAIADRPASAWEQARAVARLEVRRLRRGPNSVGRIVLLALPVFIALVVALVFCAQARDAFVDPLLMPTGPRPAAAELAVAGHVFRWFELTFVVYFAAMELFGNLLRGEMAARTLHLLYLTPVRRELIVASKYVAGVGVLFGATLVSWMLTLALVLAPHGPGPAAATLLSPQGLAHLATYAGVLLLAALAYGGLFLALGTVFRAPLHVGFGLWVWERLTLLLPQSFKRLTVTHWLDSLVPVRALPDGLFVSLPEPEPAWLAVAVLLCIAGAGLGVAALAARRLELDYGGAD